MGYYRCDVPIGNKVTFNVTELQPSNCIVNYAWIKSGTTISIVSSGNSVTTIPSYTTPSTPTDDDYYWCSITGSSTEYCLNTYYKESRKIRINVVMTSQINRILTVSPSLATCSGTTYTFTAYHTGQTSTVYYQFIIDGSNVGSSSTTNTYSTNSFSSPYEHTVKCKIGTSSEYDNSGYTNETSIYINPKSTPSVHITGSTSNTYCSGSTLNFYMDQGLNLGVNPIYAWYKRKSMQLNWTLIDGAISPSYISNNFENDDQLKLFVSNISTAIPQCSTTGSTTSNILTIPINNNVTPTISVTSDLVSCITLPMTVTFEATYTNGGTSPSFHWYTMPYTTTYDGGSTWNKSFTISNINGHTEFRVVCKMTSNAQCVTQTIVSDYVDVQLCNFYEGQTYGMAANAGRIFYISSDSIYITPYQFIVNSNIISNDPTGWYNPNSVEIGYGSINTEYIPSGTTGIIYYIKNNLNNPSYGGYSDWFLPSFFELLNLFANRRFLDFDEDWQWSSSRHWTNNNNGFYFLLIKWPNTLLPGQSEPLYLYQYSSSPELVYKFKIARKEYIPSYWYIGKLVNAHGVKVFYVGEEYVLMSYPYDIPSNNYEDPFLEWKCSGTFLNCTGIDLFSGHTNTVNITLWGCSNTGAASYCSGLSYYGYSDWYLPSIEELKIMCFRCDLINQRKYWSSSESSSDFAYVAMMEYYYFPNYTSNSTYKRFKISVEEKIKKFYVRPIRRQLRNS